MLKSGSSPFYAVKHLSPSFRVITLAKVGELVLADDASGLAALVGAGDNSRAKT